MLFYLELEEGRFLLESSCAYVILLFKIASGRSFVDTSLPAL